MSISGWLKSFCYSMRLPSPQFDFLINGVEDDRYQLNTYQAGTLSSSTPLIKKSKWAEAGGSSVDTSCQTCIDLVTNILRV